MLPARIVPDASTLACLPPSAILPLLYTVGAEICYLCQVGFPRMDEAESSAYLIDLWDQVDELHPCRRRRRAITEARRCPWT